MTSADARTLIKERGIDAAHAENLEKVLRACERARYASQPLSPNELNALISAAEAAILQIGDQARKGSAA